MAGKNLTLTYTINLAGNIQRQAVTTAKVIEQSAKVEQKALQGVDQQAVKTGKSLGKIGSMVDAKYLTREMGAVTRNTQQANQALARMGSTTFSRTLGYLTQISSKLDGVKNRAQQAMAMAGRVGQIGAQVGAGVMAGGAVAARAVEKPMAFNDMLADMANTAFADRDVPGRLTGMGELEKSINQAVTEGKGSRNDAGEALNELIASGVVEPDAAMKMLPGLQKAATASGAKTVELANIALRGMQNYGITSEQIPEAISKAIAAGQAGGFELKDMSRWLPQMMAMSKGMVGMQGMAGFEKLLSYSQASVITAGTKDQAGNNLLNLLGKINSRDTQDDFKKLGYDLTGSLTKATEQGFDPVYAFVDFTKQIAAKDTRFAELQKKANAAGSDEEKKKIYDQMGQVLQGSAIGQVIQDKEALMALLAIMQNGKYVQEVGQKVEADKGEATEKNFQVKALQVSGSVQDVKNQWEISQSEFFKNYEGPLKTLLDSITGMAKEFPALATAANGAATALGIIGAAGAGSMLTGFFLNKGKGGKGGMPGVPGMPGGSGAIPVYIVNDPSSMPGLFGDNKGTGPDAVKSRMNPSMAKGGTLFMQLGMLSMFADVLGANDSMKASNDFHRKDGSLNVYQAVGNAQLDRTKGLAEASQGDWLSASAHLSIGEMVGAAWDKLRGRNPLDSVEGGDRQQRINTMAQVMNTQMTNIVQQAIASTKEKPQQVEIGKGQLNVSVAVQDNRTEVSTAVTQPLTNMQINAGATNPGGAGG